MNREIKFRAFNDLRGMSCPFYLTDSVVEWRDAQGDLFACTGLDTLGAFDSVVMQYTGLKDSKGVEIYEGYIVMYENDYPGDYVEPSPPESHNDFAVVEWSEEARWNLNCKPFAKDNREDWADWIHEYDGGLEIIGNVFQNPELLTGLSATVTATTENSQLNGEMK